jgi:outer membrane protein TolC
MYVYTAVALAQNLEADTRVSAIESIGRELVVLLNQLGESENDPTRRLPLKPMLEKAEKAVSASPIFKQADIAKSGAEASIKESMSGYYPQINMGTGSGYRNYDYSNSLSLSGSYQSSSITVKQMLYDFEGTKSGVMASENRQTAVKLKSDYVRSEVMLQAIKTFYETQRTLLQVRLARENLQARRSFVSFIRERSDLGASSSADVIRAESRVAEGLDALSTALQALSQAQAGYRQFYNTEAEPYILPVELPFGDFDQQDLEKYIQNHPLNLEAEMNMLAARNDLNVARAKFIGGVYLEISRSDTKSPGETRFKSDNTAMVFFRSDLYTGGAATARVEQAKSKALQAEFEYDRTKQDLLRGLREALSEYNGHVASVGARMLVYKGAEDSYGISKDLYAFSRSSLFEVLKSQEDLFNSGQRLIDSIISRAISRYKLMHATHLLTDRIEEAQR